MATYRIIRYFQNHDNVLIRNGCTLDEVQRHCQDPETSSRTAKSPEAKRRTKLKGPWFDGYKENRDTPRQPTMLERAMDAYIHDRGR